MSHAFLISGARTPVGRSGGAVASDRPVDLTASVARAGVPAEAVDEVVPGVGKPSEPADAVHSVEDGSGATAAPGPGTT